MKKRHEKMNQKNLDILKKIWYIIWAALKKKSIRSHPGAGAT